MLGLESMCNERTKKIEPSHFLGGGKNLVVYNTYHFPEGGESESLTEGPSPAIPCVCVCVCVKIKTEIKKKGHLFENHHFPYPAGLSTHMLGTEQRPIPSPAIPCVCVCVCVLHVKT